MVIRIAQLSLCTLNQYYDIYTQKYVNRVIRISSLSLCTLNQYYVDIFNCISLAIRTLVTNNETAIIFSD